MRIALLHPTYWPEVRRDLERVVHDLATGLAARGHEVTVLTSHGGAGAVTTEEGVSVDRARRPPYMRPLRWYEDHVATMPLSALRLKRGGFDLAHAFSLPDAWAAAQIAGRLGGPPLVATLPALPTRAWLVERRYRMQMLSSVLRAAAAVTVPSEAAADATRRYLVLDPNVVRGGVGIGPFAAADGAPAASTVLCPVSLAEPARRDLLLDGFAGLRSRLPAAQLRIVRPVDPMAFSWGAPSRPPAVSWVEAHDTAALADAYATASISVVPGADDAWGIPAIESLAAGRPVVAAHSGALPEIIDAPRMGSLFEPGDPGSLAETLAAALEATGDAGDAEARRAAARGFDASAALDRYEEIYAEAAG